MLGLKKNLNLLVDYDHAWESAFIDERKRVAVALGTVAKGVEHYGSTAVPGMRAKPILDILVGVNPIDDWEKCRIPLERLGYDGGGCTGGARQIQRTQELISHQGEGGSRSNGVNRARA